MSAPSAAPLDVRLRVSRLLSTSDLDPGLPPGAILVVRRIDDPLPGEVRPDRLALRPPARWQRALRGRVDRAWKGAARPWTGSVPPSAPAVFFADPAEMLAALALDAVAGIVRTRWWWAALLRAPGERGPAALARAWIREARHVPAALAMLERRRALADVSRALSPVEAGAVLEAVMVAFGLTELRRAWNMDVGAAQAQVGSNGGPGHGSRTGPMRAASDTPAPPWMDLLTPDTAAAASGPDHLALLGIGLSLAHAPLPVGNSAFARATGQWRATLARQDPAPAGTDRGPSDPPARPHGRGGRGPQTQDAPGPPSAADAARTSGRKPPAEAGPPPASHVPRSTGDPRTGESRRAPHPGRGPRKGAAATRPEPPPQGARPRPEPATVRSRPVDSGAPSGEPLATDAGVRVHSALCGAFFLVNALRATDWFARAAERAPDAPIRTGWAWLELVARELLGRRAPRYDHDPLWGLLAELDGRDPGHSRWASDPAISAVLAEALPPLRRRLRVALRTRAGRGGLGRALLQREGVVVAGRTHVDVWMDLDQVTLSVRLAGLDTDPGWVPELGRVLAFHFEAQT